MEWIKTSEKMPKPGKVVLAFTENGIIIRTCWIPKFYMCDNDADYVGDCDYNEEKDVYYWPEGWYEWNLSEDIHYKVDVNITHWMPLPKHP